jgi:hypothetical protein
MSEISQNPVYTGIIINQHACVYMCAFGHSIGALLGRAKHKFGQNDQIEDVNHKNLCHGAPSTKAFFQCFCREGLGSRGSWETADSQCSDSLCTRYTCRTQCSTLLRPAVVTRAYLARCETAMRRCGLAGPNLELAVAFKKNGI